MLQGLFLCIRRVAILGFLAAGFFVLTHTTAHAAWTLVGETSQSFAGGGADADITLPGSPATDDIVIVACVSDLDFTATTINTSGYTSLFENLAGSPAGILE